MEISEKKGDAMSVEEAEYPYRSLALIYDGLLGDAAFASWRERFERVVRRYEIAYRTVGDIACGTGQAADYLAQKCAIVFGTDSSEDMLQIARRKRKRDNIHYLRQSFLELDLPQPVDMITCNFDSLNYLTRESDLEYALGRFAGNLKRGGCAIFDMNTEMELREDTDGRPWIHRVGESYSVWQSDWDALEGVHTLRMQNFIYAGEGMYRLGEEVHRERCYDTGLVLDMLKTTGFARAVAHDAKDLSDVDDETRRVQFLAWR